MSTDNPSTDDTSSPPVAPSALSRPDLKRTLKELLVQDEVSDSDVEMLEKHSLFDEQMEDSVDPDMCVECGDQVTYIPLSLESRTDRALFLESVIMV